MIEHLDERNAEIASVKESMFWVTRKLNSGFEYLVGNLEKPMEEIYFVRGLYIFVLLIELGFSYWPFVGYTTRPHGLLMAGLGHCIS